jgi:hypothetical protein
MSGGRAETAAWRRANAIASEDGFNSYLEQSGKRVRFVIDATIADASQISKLQEFIARMAAILELSKPTIEIGDLDWAE